MYIHNKKKNLKFGKKSPEPLKNKASGVCSVCSIQMEFQNGMFLWRNIICVPVCPGRPALAAGIY